jgi:hypothetical protein
MWMRIIVFSLAMYTLGCSGAGISGGDVRLAGQKCLTEADNWLAKPADKEQLARALKASKQAKSTFEKDETANRDKVFGDIDLLYGALNMAQMGAEEGLDPTRPSSMSEVPVVASVRIVANQLRDHLAATPNATP